MRDAADIVIDITEAEGTPPDLVDELFWSCMVRGLAAGVASWGKLFCDVRGWTKGGDMATAEVERITDAEAAKLVKAVLGEP